MRQIEVGDFVTIGANGREFSGTILDNSEGLLVLQSGRLLYGFNQELVADIVQSRHAQ